MSKATDLDSPASPEEAAPRDGIKYRDTPLVFVHRAPACNDATCEDSPISKDDVGEIIVEVIRAVGAIVGAVASRALARYRQRQRARATYDALRELDDRALRDLGLDRSELRSVAAEVTGEAERTRVRAIPLAEAPERHAPSAVRPHRNAVPASY